MVVLSILLVLICCFNTVNASDDINATVINPDDMPFYINDINDEIIYEEPSNTQIIDLNDSECCSFVIQENEETIYGFRQDAKLNGHGIQINAINWYGVNVLKQEIDSHEYFFHSIITENGWVISQGGSQYNESSRAIEQIAATMFLNEDISPNYLLQIRDVLRRYTFGHFLIKDPQGHYGIAFLDTYLTGTLQPGEYLVVPNYYSYYKRGTYKSYSSNPVNALIVICSYDPSGLNRRNLITYDYKVKETPDGVFHGVDVYATNDNGYNVGLNTANIVTHVFYKGTYYAPTSIPQNPGKIQLGTHIFESQYFGKTIELTPTPNCVLIGEERALHYKIVHVSGEKTFVIHLGNDIELLNVDLNQGSYTYDSGNNIIYWKIPNTRESRDMTIIIRSRDRGNHVIQAYIQGMNEINAYNFYVTDASALVTTYDVIKYKGGSQSLVVYLKDKYDVSLLGEKVAISINGNTYYREITSEGHASLAINLGSGTYPVNIEYNGKFGKTQTSAQVTVKTTIFSSDVEKYYKNDTQFYATFLDTDGNPLRDSKVNFNINGVIYTRTTDNDGVARLNINLNPNKYIITSINPINNDQKSSLITVKSLIFDNNDLVKYHGNDSKYSVKIRDKQGNPVVGAEVKFNINGVVYTRISDENATAELAINLLPGDYIITAEYMGNIISNNINILPLLSGKNILMKYGDGTSFEAKLVDIKGNPLEGEIITFNINGVFYNRTTDSAGISVLKINLIYGEYVITSTHSTLVASNRIIILPKDSKIKFN